MPSSRECLRRKGATTQSCFVFKVNSGLAPEVSGRTLRSYYEASIEMGVRDLNNFRMVQWTIPVPSVWFSGIAVLGFPCEGNSTALQRAPSFLPDVADAVLRQVNGLQLVSIEHPRQGQGVTDIPGCRRGCGVLLLLPQFRKEREEEQEEDACVSKKESLRTH